MDSHVLQEAHHITAPSGSDGSSAKSILEDEVPPDDPRDEPTGVRANESMIRYRSCVQKLHENYIVIPFRMKKSIPLRFAKAQENAAALAKKLVGHSSVTNVRYPGFGAIISFEIAGDAAAAERVCDGASLIINATSLGGVETTWERRRRWQLESHSIPENLIRISVGCENVDDLWRDIDTALTKA